MTLRFPLVVVVVSSVLGISACALPDNFACSRDEDCSGGHTCQEGRCAQVCGLTVPCPDGLVCDLSRGACMTPAQVAFPDAGVSVSSSSSVMVASSASTSSSSVGTSSSAASSSSSPASSSAAASTQGSSSGRSSSSVGASSAAPSSSGDASSSAMSGSTSMSTSAGASSSSAGMSSSSNAPSSSLPVAADPRCAAPGGGIRTGEPCGGGDFCQVAGTCDDDGACTGESVRACLGAYHPVCSADAERCICTAMTGCPGGFCVNGQCIISREVAINHGDDDAFEYANGTMDRASTGIYLNALNHRAGLYFDALGVARGSTILAANLRVYVNSAGTEDRPREDWRVEDSVTPASIATTSGNLTNRSGTLSADFVRWEGNDTGEGWADSPDMRTLLAPLVMREGWNESRNVLFVGLRTNTSEAFNLRTEDYTGDFAPRLLLTWLPPEQPLP